MHVNIPELTFTILISFFIGIILALVISKMGDKLGLIDVPNVRSSHVRPIPRGGGIGIALAVTLITVVFAPVYYILVVIIFCLSAYSLIDDLRGLPVKRKLMAQVLAAAFVIVLYQDSIILLGSIIQNFFTVLWAFLLLLYLVAAANFFNFMDGINGIAGIEALISFLFVGVFHLTTTHDHHLLILCISVCAATAGFLLMNFPKAKVFMGDTGSIYLGFLFAVLVILSARSFKEFLFLLTFQAVFYIDCLSTIFLRRLRKENIFVAHKFHLYQELVHKKGWSHTKVTLTYGAIQVLVGSFAWLILSLNLMVMILFWSLLMGVYIAVRMRFFDIMDNANPTI